MKINRIIKFDSATVTLDRMLKTDAIVLNVAIEKQAVPVSIATPSGNVVVNYEWDPVNKTFTPQKSPTGNIVFPNDPSGNPQNVPGGFTPPAIPVIDAQGNPLQGPHAATDNFFMPNVPTINPDGSLKLPGTVLDPNGNVITPGQMTLTNFEKLAPTISFVSQQNGASIQDTSQIMATRVGDWIKYKDANGNWIVAKASTIQGMPAQSDGTLAFDTFVTTTHLINKDGTGADEKFTESAETLASLMKLEPVIDNSGQVTWTSRTAQGNIAIYITQNGDNIVVHQEPMHSFTVQTPTSNGNKEIISNGEQLVVQLDSDTNHYVLSSIKTDGTSEKILTRNVNVEIQKYILNTLGTSANENMRKYIESLTFVLNQDTGEIIPNDTSTEKFGFKIGADSRLTFNNSGFFLNIIQVDNAHFHVPISLTVSSPQLHGQATTDASVNVDLGQIKFNPVTGEWIMDPTVPGTPNSDHPDIKFRFNPSDDTFILTTDGTFVPKNDANITWEEPVASINGVHTFVGHQNMFTHVAPTQAVSGQLSADAVIDSVPFTLDVELNHTSHTPITPYGSSLIEHNRFTGSISRVVKSDLSSSYTTPTGVDPLKSISASTTHRVIGKITPQDILLDVKPIDGFTQTRDVSSGQIVVHLSSDFSPNTGTTSSANPFQSSLWHPTIDINGVKDSAGKPISIRGTITQNPLTGEYNVVDDKGQTLSQLTGGTLDATITPLVDGSGNITNFTVSLKPGISSTSYDFESGTQSTSNFDGSNSKTTADGITVNGDTLTICM